MLTACSRFYDWTGVMVWIEEWTILTERRNVLSNFDGAQKKAVLIIEQAAERKNEKLFCFPSLRENASDCILSSFLSTFPPPHNRFSSHTPCLARLQSFVNPFSQSSLMKLLSRLVISSISWIARSSFPPPAQVVVLETLQDTQEKWASSKQTKLS